MPWAEIDLEPRRGLERDERSGGSHRLDELAEGR